MDKQLKKLDSNILNKKNISDVSLNVMNINNSNFNQSQSSFTASNKTDTYTSTIHIMKSDLIQLQDKINESELLLNSIKNSSNSYIKKKIAEIEEGKKEGIKYKLDKISEEANDIDKISKLYKTTKKSELINRLTNEVFLYELIFKKLNEYFFVFCLTNNNIIDNTNFISNIKETRSKTSIFFNCLNNIIEKTLKKEDVLENNINNQKKIMITETNKINNSNELMLNAKSIEDLFGTNDRICNHIENLVSNYIKSDINDHILMLNNKLNLKIKKLDNINENYKLEIFKNKKIDINKYLTDKASEINNLKLNLEELQKNININNNNNSHENSKLCNIAKCKEDSDSLKLLNSELHNNIEEKNLIINQKNIEISNLNEMIKKNNKNNIINEKILTNSNDNSDVNSLIKIINENNKKMQEINDNHQSNYNKLHDEIKKLKIEIDNLNSKNSVIKDEGVLLEKQINLLKSNKGIIKDAYEELLIEQFDTMRNAFVSKIENMNIEINNIKINSRKSILYIEEELSQEKHIKELFLKQITDLQKHFNIK